MKPASWIQPATFIMNKLGFRTKFALILSLFALPLALLILATMGSLTSSLHNNQKQINELENIKKVTHFIQQLENFRDLHTLNFLFPSTRFQAGYGSAKGTLLKKFKELDKTITDPKYHQPLIELKKAVSALKIAPGMEAVRTQYVYQNTNNIVSRAYAIRTSMINLSGLFNNQDERIALLANFVANDMHGVFQALGASRVYGTFYLTQEYINSNGVDVLDNTYNDIEKLILSLDNSISQFQGLFSKGFPILSHPPVIPSLKKIQSDLDNDLIQALTLSASPDQFYDIVSHAINQNYQFLSRIYDVQHFLLQQQRNEKQQALNIYLVIVIFITCIFIYLFLGFAISLKANIRFLINAAYNVSQGEFDQKIRLNVNDELKELSFAMNKMRSQLHTRENQLKELISTDGLTGLKNRKCLDEMLEVDLSRCSRSHHPIAFILMDIDHFKKVNDSYGHPAGDACLRQLSEEIKKSFQRKSDCTARYGGEEFAIILPNTTLEQAKLLAEHFRQSVESLKIDLTTTQLKITISIGISCCIPNHQFPAQALIAAADSALYQAKNNGRNQCCIRDMHSNKRLTS